MNAQWEKNGDKKNLEIREKRKLSVIKNRRK